MSASKKQGSFYQENILSAMPMQLRLLRGTFGALGSIAPGVAHRLAVNFFFTPRGGRTSANIRPFKKSAHRFFVEVNSKKVPVWSWGNGPAVLMVHGWEGYGLQFRKFIKPLVEKGYRVLTFDAPAHGECDGKQSDLPEFAETIRKIETTVGAFHGIIAHSLGGAAATLALGNGVSAKCVVLISSPASTENVMAEYATIFNLSDEVKQRMGETILQRFGKPMEDFSPVKIAKKLKTPVFIVHDQGDKMVKYEDALTLSAALPQPKLLVTEGLGHKRILYHRQVIDSCIRFLEQPNTFQPAVFKNKSANEALINYLHDKNRW